MDYRKWMSLLTLFIKTLQKKKKKQQSMLTLWIDVNQCQQIGVANFVRK